MTLWGACLAAEVAALVAAVVYARRSADERYSSTYPGPGARPVNRWAVVLLAFAVLSDVAMRCNQVLVLEPWREAHPTGPFVGAVAAPYLMELALTFAWPAALAACTWRVFAGLWSRRTMPLTTWALVVLAVVAAHPLPRGWTATLLRVWSLLAVAVGVVAVVRAWLASATWGRSPIHASVLVLLGTEAAVALVGPYVRDPFSDWDYARILYAIGFGAVAVILGQAARAGPRS